jgi:membrane fusion protein (multidrug efflux system)
MRAPRNRRFLLGPIRYLHPVFAASVVVVFLAACKPADPPPPPPLEIRVVDVVQRDQPITMEMVGETRGSADIPIRTRVEGVVLTMNFVEGRPVEKDQLLYTIDPEPFESEVIEAQGAMAEVQTRLVKAKSDLNRIRPLAEMHAVSQSDLDGAVAQYEAMAASLQSASARVEQARIRLGYTRISSPIAGRISISEARVGEFVGMHPNPVVLNYVSKTDPIRVRFSVDERTVLAMSRRVQEFRQETGEAPKMGEALELTLADGTIHPFPGHIVAADASVNASTGTFTLEADFPNPPHEGFVVAGQFARVRAISEVRKDALLIPSRAATELQGSFRVYVIDDDGTVELRPVELGPIIDNFRIVESGVKPGERVAIEIMRLQPGMTVKPKLVALNDKGIPDKGIPDKGIPKKGTPKTPNDSSKSASPETPKSGDPKGS